jgi:radial spoke head protein 4A
MDESTLYEWAGISLGRTDTYRLYLSIKKFSETLPAEVERLRFFGVIKTRGAPYYIVEGLSPEDEEGIDESKQEGRNGVNKYAYWVTQSTESTTWTKLPNVTMEQIVTSRKFKKYLTGNLDAPVNSFPPFPGNERHFLRTQIALIAGATTISPAGYFELNEDEDPPVVKLAEQETLNEIGTKTSADLKELDAWVHHELELNAIGRILAMPEQLDENGEPIEPEEPVELTPPLKAIEPENWSVRVCPGGAGEHLGSLVAVRSQQWPGAFAIAGGRRFVNIYIGYGVKYDAKSYSPPLPASIQTEWTPSEDDKLEEEKDPQRDPTPPKADEEEE